MKLCCICGDDSQEILDKVDCNICDYCYNSGKVCQCCLKQGDESYFAYCGVCNKHILKDCNCIVITGCQTTWCVCKKCVNKVDMYETCEICKKQLHINNFVSEGDRYIIDNDDAICKNCK